MSSRRACDRLLVAPWRAGAPRCSPPCPSMLLGASQRLCASTTTARGPDWHHVPHHRAVAPSLRRRRRGPQRRPRRGPSTLRGGTSVGFLPDSRADRWSKGRDGGPEVLRRNAKLLEASLVLSPAYRDAKVYEARS